MKATRTIAATTDRASKNENLRQLWRCKPNSEDAISLRATKASVLASTWFHAGTIPSNRNT